MANKNPNGIPARERENAHRDVDAYTKPTTNDTSTSGEGISRSQHNGVII